MIGLAVFIGSTGLAIGGVAVVWASVSDNVPEDVRLYTLSAALFFLACCLTTIAAAWGWLPA